MNRVVPALARLLVVVLGAGGCGAAPATSVGLDDDHSRSAAFPMFVYRAYWQACTTTLVGGDAGSSDAGSP
jgi:hypothetical protein